MFRAASGTILGASFKLSASPWHQQWHACNGACILPTDCACTHVCVRACVTHRIRPTPPPSHPHTTSPPWQASVGHFEDGGSKREDAFTYATLSFAAAIPLVMALDWVAHRWCTTPVGLVRIALRDATTRTTVCCVIVCCSRSRLPP